MTSTKTYRAKALDTGEWIYGSQILFLGDKAFIEIEDDDSYELVVVDSSTTCHSVNLYDTDGIQLFTHDIIYVKRASGIQFLAEVLDFAGETSFRELETGQRTPPEDEDIIQLKGTYYSDLGEQKYYPF